MADSRGNNHDKPILFSKSFIGSAILVLLLIATLIGAFIILLPYLHPIILAGVFAMIFHPIHAFIEKKVGKRPNLAAGLTCVVVALLVIVPLISFTSILVVKARTSVLAISKWVRDGKLERELGEFGIELKVDKKKQPTGPEQIKCPNCSRPICPVCKTPAPADQGLPPIAPPDKEKPAPKASEPKAKEAKEENKAATTDAPKREIKPWKKKVRALIEKTQAKCKVWFPNWEQQNLGGEAVDWVTTKIGTLAPRALDHAARGLGLVVNFFLMIFVMFYFFRDGSKIVAYIIQLSPLNPKHEQMLISRIRDVTRSAVMGTVLTAVAQGALGMIAFAVLGVPWFFWGVVMGFASLIPLVGTALVWIPCCIYLLIMGKTWSAIILAVWCIVVVGMSDNFLRPFLMQGNTGMNSIIAFFAILGGLQCFGLIGVIYGPLIFGLCAMLLYLYELELNPSPAPAPAQNRKRRKRRRRRPRNQDRDRVDFDD